MGPLESRKILLPRSVTTLPEQCGCQMETVHCERPRQHAPCCAPLPPTYMRSLCANCPWREHGALQLLERRGVPRCRVQPCRGPPRIRARASRASAGCDGRRCRGTRGHSTRGGCTWPARRPCRRPARDPAARGRLHLLLFDLLRCIGTDRQNVEVSSGARLRCPRRCPWHGAGSRGAGWERTRSPSNSPRLRPGRSRRYNGRMAEMSQTKPWHRTTTMMQDVGVVIPLQRGSPEWAPGDLRRRGRARHLLREHAGTCSRVRWRRPDWSPRPWSCPAMGSPRAH